MPVTVKKRNAGRTAFQKEFNTTHELCSLIKKLSEAQSLEILHRHNEDYRELKQMTENLKKEDELSLLAIDAAMGIVNLSMRKMILRRYLSLRLKDEREITVMMQNHKEEFTQFIWKRRLQSKRDLRLLFQQGAGIIGRLGDLVADSSIDAIQQFEKICSARLCKDRIDANDCELEDIPGFFNQKVLLRPPKVAFIKLATTRTDFYLSQDPNLVKEHWYCLYSTSGPWTLKLYSRPHIKDIVSQHLDQLKNTPKEAEFSYSQSIARLLDLVHSSHQLPANLLAYPLYSSSILKKRLLALNYDLGNQGDENASFLLDQKVATDIVRQIDRRLDKELRAYFEFMVPSKALWRVGLAVSTRSVSFNNDYIPGSDEFSLAFDNYGDIHVNNSNFEYFHGLQTSNVLNNTKTIGIMINMHAGNIHLVVDGKLQGAAFGRDSTAFETAERERQRRLIVKNQLLAVFALQKTQSTAADEQPMIKVNFGDRQFMHTINASSLNHIVQHSNVKLMDSISVIEGSTTKQYRDKMAQEEDEKMHLSLEKSYFKTSLLPEAIKSFSQFPPSVYRRSLAATRIQRAFRRYRGRKMRITIRKLQTDAVIKIQKHARKFLKKLKDVKNKAAAKIQKAWRRKLLIWMALMRCVYQQPISVLHRAATTIQRKWRHWHMFKNSPFAVKFHRKVEELEKAAIKIQQWWRPMMKKVHENRRGKMLFNSVMRIQAYWRGFRLRKQIKPDLRHKLLHLGRVMLQAREGLFRIQAAYKIQRWYRASMEKKIINQKKRTRHLAAKRIQAFWKGFWVRSHTALRFNYGEAIFLTAVCKALRQCHFILKMYRPCGIVCPKREKKAR